MCLRPTYFTGLTCLWKFLYYWPSPMSKRTKQEIKWLSSDIKDGWQPILSTTYDFTQNPKLMYCSELWHAHTARSQQGAITSRQCVTGIQKALDTRTWCYRLISFCCQITNSQLFKIQYKTKRPFRNFVATLLFLYLASALAKTTQFSPISQVREGNSFPCRQLCLLHSYSVVCCFFLWNGAIGR